MGQMTAMIKIHPKDCVPWLQKGEVNSHVGLGSGVGLDIGMLYPKQRPNPFNGESFHHVHVLTTAVVSPVGISFGILIGHDIGLCFNYRPRSVILRCNHD